MEKALMSFDIDNFSKRQDAINTDAFSSSGGCKWFLTVFPKGHQYRYSDHLCLVLNVADPESLRFGWKWRAGFCFVFLNQSGEELYRSPEGCELILLFCANASNRAYITLPLTKLLEKGFLENDKLIIQIYINVVEVVHQGKSTENELLEENSGLRMTPMEAQTLEKIMEEHLDVVSHYKPKNEEAQRTCAVLFFGLLETLSKSPLSLSVTELINAQNQLTELTETGFKLDWLKSKLEEAFLARNKALSDGSLVLLLEERVKTVEMTVSDLKVELDKEKKIRSATLSLFEVIDLLIDRFFFSCFSISKY